MTETMLPLPGLSPVNGKLDRNFLGVPLEPYGFTNGRHGYFRPPTFDEAAIELPWVSRRPA